MWVLCTVYGHRTKHFAFDRFRPVAAASSNVGGIGIGAAGDKGGAGGGADGGVGPGGGGGAVSMDHDGRQNLAEVRINMER